MKNKVLYLCLLFSNAAWVCSQTKTDTTVFKIKFLSEDSITRRDSVRWKNNIKAQLGALIYYQHPQLSYQRKLKKHFDIEITLGLAHVDDRILEENAMYWDTGHRAMDYRTFELMPNISISSRYYFKQVFKGWAVGPLVAYRPMKSLYENPITKFTYKEKYRYLDAGMQVSYMCKLFRMKRFYFEILFQGGYRYVAVDYVTFDHGGPESLNRKSYNQLFIYSGFNIGFLF